MPGIGFAGALGQITIDDIIFTIDAVLIMGQMWRNQLAKKK
jgi:hypothetical protein